MSVQNDLLSHLLRSMQVSASLLLADTYYAPWSVKLPSSDELVALFDQAPGTHVVAFHMVQEGDFHIALADGTERRVGAGQAAILFGGGAHRMWSGKGGETVPLSAVLSGRKPGVSSQGNVSGSPPDHTRLVCGAFSMRHTRLNPLFDALPALAILSVGSGGWLASVGEQLGRELHASSPGSEFVVERLLELFCAEAVRDYMVSTDVGAHRGWFRALKDEAVLKALRAMHSNPALPWTVESLAREAQISRSRLSERFALSMGESLMQYLSKWRMSDATRMLIDTRHSVQRVANEVGYESSAAFSRAFKQQLGVSPAKFRATEQRNVVTD
ncbi:MAG: AraC family transcriptional regulator [Gammaproteobacteria bacterium]|nr:AraC family transcriptional regulator [Gammaproteobacteria bacterium]